MIKDRAERAFPSTFKSIGPEQEQIHVWGMELRDYLAAKAMQGILMHGYPITQEANAEHKIAKAAYQQADAMMKAREQ